MNAVPRPRHARPGRGRSGIERSIRVVSLYVPRHFDAPDRVAIARLLHDHPFSTLLTPVVEGEPHVSHLPLLWVAGCEPYGTLLGHFARANPQLEALRRAPRALFIFQRPHG